VTIDAPESPDRLDVAICEFGASLLTPREHEILEFLLRGYTIGATG
jgi:DNA-binding CsgD family transcriptional regulator